MRTFTLHGTTHESHGVAHVAYRRSELPEGFSWLLGACEVHVAKHDDPPRPVTCMLCLAAER